MTQSNSQRAAPPDDGGGDGSFTEPEQALLAEPGDTRSSEQLGKEPPRAQGGNRGLLWFFASIVALMALMVLASYVKDL